MEAFLAPAKTEDSTANNGLKSRHEKHLVPVQPVMSEQLAQYLQSGQYPHPTDGLTAMLPFSTDRVIVQTNNILQAIAYWAFLIHVICDYSLSARVSKRPKMFSSYTLQFNSEPMKIEYSDGETWYLEFTATVFSGVCNFIPIEYDYRNEIEKSLVGGMYIRKDTVYTMWAKFLIPGKFTGYTYFDVLNKEMKKIAVDGILSVTFQDLYLYIKLVLKEVDHGYRQDDIFFRVPELTLDYDYANLSVQIARTPKYETKDVHASHPNIDQILEDFFNQQLRDKTMLIRRIVQSQLNFVGLRMMKAKSVAQALCILNEAVSNRPANFNKCNNLLSETISEIFFLVNDEKMRNYFVKWFKSV